LRIDGCSRTLHVKLKPDGGTLVPKTPLAQCVPS
jgi:hypothetical protein